LTLNAEIGYKKVGKELRAKTKEQRSKTKERGTQNNFVTKTDSLRLYNQYGES